MSAEHHAGSEMTVARNVVLLLVHGKHCTRLVIKGGGEIGFQFTSHVNVKELTLIY